MEKLEAVITRDALGWVLLVCGALWLTVLLWFGSNAATVQSGEAGMAAGYLGGVVTRSLQNPFQGALLAALIAVPLHAIWTFTFRREAKVALAYDQFGVWAQTLLTSLGFMGTIIGVSLAVAGLEEAMTAGKPGELISGLSTAFDTTFLGLAGSVLLLAFRKSARLWRGV